MKRLLVVLVLLLAAAAGYLFAYDPDYSGDIDANRSTPLLFAHRGFGDFGPDNSLAAAKRAVGTPGIDGVDVDAQLTKDGKIVVFHDLRLDRLTSADGRVGEHTLAEMEALDLAPKYEGKPFGGSYDKAPVRSFETFVRQIPPEGLLMTELKVTEKGDTGMEREAVRILRKYDAFDRVYLSSFNPLVIRRLERLDRRVRTVFVFMDTNWNAELLAEMRPEDVVDLPWFLRTEWTRRAVRKLIRPDALSVNVEVAAKTRKHLIESGWPVMLWAPDAPDAIADALAQHPYGVISDQPLQAAKQAHPAPSTR